MPHKHYHGRTGVVFNVNKRAVGVIIDKEVNGRIIPKRLHIAGKFIALIHLMILFLIVYYY